MPRFTLEAITFGGMLLIVLYLISQVNNFVNAIPIIGLYAFAGYRLIPALQQIYNSLILLRIVGPSLDSIHNDLNSLELKLADKVENPLQFNKEIRLDHIHYFYPNTSRTALKDISLTIKARTTVGLVGITGSGKTTVADIILGLLGPQEGKLIVDGVEINKFNRRAWQKNIGYVPQQIYLADTSIINNIAFGVEKKDIKQEDVERAAKIANIDNFIVNELPFKYDTFVGERGVRLSGGQRQLIGIARALYHNPKLLILDESTSALDNLTEQSVINKIYSLRKNITIIMISHRLSTIEKCDEIFLFEEGRLKNQGIYSEIISSKGGFRNKIINS